MNVSLTGKYILGGPAGHNYSVKRHFRLAALFAWKARHYNDWRCVYRCRLSSVSRLVA